MLVIERHNAIICAYDVRVNTVSAAVIVNTGYEFELSGGVKSELQLDVVVGSVIAIILFFHIFPAFPAPTHYENSRLNGQL